MSCTCPAGCNAALRSLPNLRPRGTDVLASVQTRSDAASSLRLRSIKALILWEAHLLHRRSVSMATYRFLGARASCRHTRDSHGRSHGRSPAFRSVPPPPTPPAPPPPLHRRLTSDVGHMLQDLFACLSPLITPLSTLRLQRGVVGEVCCPLVHYFSLPSVLFFFFSLTAAEQRSCNNSLKDTWSCGLFMRGCRMWDSVSGKKLRNPPVYTPPSPHTVQSGTVSRERASRSVTSAGGTAFPLGG